MADAAPAAEIPATPQTEPEVPKAEPETPKPEPEAATPEPEVTPPKTEPETPKPEPEPSKPEEAEATPSSSSAAAAAEPDKPEAETPKETYATMPKPKYDPMLAHSVRHPKSYASTVIADQETLLANLRHMRRALEKEDRQLSIMAKTLFNQEYPRKWTPPNRYLYDD